MGRLHSLTVAAQDLGDPSKQPAWARLQHELPPAVTAWAAAAEQMAAATTSFLVCERARHPVKQWSVFCGMVHVGCKLTSVTVPVLTVAALYLAGSIAAVPFATASGGQAV